MEIENRYQKFEKLPENIQDALLSPETADLIYQAGKLVNLSDGKISLLAELVGDVFIDELKESDLTNKIKITLDVDDIASENLSTKIDETIKSIRSKQTVQVEKPQELDEDIKTWEGENLQGETTQFKPVFVKEPQAIPYTPTSKAQISPQPKPSIPQTVTKPQLDQKILTQNKPFILHSEEEIEPAKEASFQPVAQEPVFYKPTFSEEYKKSVLEKEAASIELGEETKKKQQPESFKTPIKEARIVHYSEFRTPLGPFENQGMQRIQELNQIIPGEKLQSEQSRASEVHPNNVVDLKDLPL